jgi:hypothetical protein
VNTTRHRASRKRENQGLYTPLVEVGLLAHGPFELDLAQVVPGGDDCSEQALTKRRSHPSGEAKQQQQQRALNAEAHGKGY